MFKEVIGRGDVFVVFGREFGKFDVRTRAEIENLEFAWPLQGGYSVRITVASTAHLLGSLCIILYGTNVFVTQWSLHLYSVNLIREKLM